MNKILANLLNNLSFLKKKHNKILVSLLLIGIVFALSIGLYLVFFNGDDIDSKWLTGTVYIDGRPAPAGTSVYLVFPQDVLKDEDGTNESGMYRVDISDFLDESFLIQINHEGNNYTGTDETGLPINGTIINNMSFILDVFVSTTSSTDDDDDIDDGSDNTDNDDDIDDGSDDTETDDDDDSTEDDVDESDSEESDDETDDTDDEEEDDENDSDTGEEEGEGEEESEDDMDASYLFVEKTVWNTVEELWKNDETTEIDKHVRFNITITVNSSNPSALQIIDMLPEGLIYSGNATMNGNNSEPIINSSTNSLIWNVSLASEENVTLFIEYDTMIVSRKVLQNNVTVDLIKNETSSIRKQSNATVRVFGDLIVSKTVRDNNETEWHDDISIDVGSPIRFNITISYDGNHTVSDLIVLDELPAGFTYLGNATLNENEYSPFISGNNSMFRLQWNISTLLPNEKIYIEFEANITEDIQLINNVEVSGNESIGKQFNKKANATVIGTGPQFFVCQKNVKVNSISWTDNIDAFVGDLATFNISITNLEMENIYGLTIIDTFPESLTYVNGSSMIFFKNQSYEKEPVYDNDTNTYFWININELITGFIAPGETIYIHYNTTITQDGISTNLVKANATLCGGCDPLTSSASATINVTIPTPELSVTLIIPDQVYVNEFVEIFASVSGGVPPYTYEWNVHNNLTYDEGTSSIIKKWTHPGTYSIRVKITDNASEMVNDTAIINVTVRPLVADAGGPYVANPEQVIQFNGSASGGSGNYTWHWDFKDGNSSTIQQPDHLYTTTGTYYVTLDVTDERNITARDTTIVTIIEPDTTPPIITMESPKNALYIKNRAVFPFIRPLVFGSINITVSARDDESAVDFIELYINDQLVKEIPGDNGTYIWYQNTFGRQSITIKSRNIAGLIATENKTIWKFF